MEEMNKIVLGTAFIMTVLVLTGCGQPKVPFHPDKKDIVFADGIPYGIPYGTRYRQIDNTQAKKFTSLGIQGCKNGDIWWIHLETFTRLEKEGKGKVFGDVAKMMFSMYKTGCAHPLNQQEYQFLLNRKNQSSANVRVASQNSAMINSSSNNQSSNSTPRYKTPTYNFPSNNNIETKKSSNTYYMHSDGTSTNKVGNTYFHSDGTTTIGF